MNYERTIEIQKIMRNEMRQGVSRELKMMQSNNLYEKLESLIEYDRLERGGIDNVMSVSTGEHLSTWQILGKRMIENIRRSNCEVDFIDVGTGSGFWAIIVADILSNSDDGYNIMAIDKVKRCVDKCKKNAKSAAVTLNIKHQEYKKESADKNCTENIFMNPPYHIYPDELHDRIPHHARGGGLGQEVFRRWIAVSDYHLASGGCLYFHHMCVGNEHPNYVKFIKSEMSSDPSIRYTNILTPVKSDYFLGEIYGSQFSSFVNNISDKFEFVFYTSGTVKRDSLGIVESNDANDEIRDLTNWAERINLHKKINNIFIH